MRVSRNDLADLGRALDSVANLKGIKFTYAVAKNKDKIESEMKALRMQMNPHFIFNSLNAIRYLILKEDTERASDYLTSFSKLNLVTVKSPYGSFVSISSGTPNDTVGLWSFNTRIRFPFSSTVLVNEPRALISPSLSLKL